MISHNVSAILTLFYCVLINLHLDGVPAVLFVFTSKKLLTPPPNKILSQEPPLPRAVDEAVQPTLLQFKSRAWAPTQQEGWLYCFMLTLILLMHLQKMFSCFPLSPRAVAPV